MKMFKFENELPIKCLLIKCCDEHRCEYKNLNGCLKHLNTFQKTKVVQQLGLWAC